MMELNKLFYVLYFIMFIIQWYSTRQWYIDRVKRFEKINSLQLRLMNYFKYKEKDLVTFGNYLLSQQRKETIINEENLDKVTDADLSNWKEL